MKICGISDMHGNLEFTVPECDLLLICGDIVPLSIQRYTKPSLRWLKDTFLKWCETQPCEKIIMVGGNHDWAFEHHRDKVDEVFDESKVSYLCCDATVYNGKIIYGTPLCHKFYNWAFMPSDEEQTQIYDEAVIKYPHVDILISHDAPYGTSDALLQNGHVTNEHIGSKPLAKLIETMKPQLALHGHLHSTNHDMELLDFTKVYNVSLLNENYQMVYRPLEIEIE